MIASRRMNTHGVTVLHAEVVVLEVDVKVGEDELLTDLLPDDAGHLVAVHLDDGVDDLDLVKGGSGAHVGEEAGGGAEDRVANRRGGAEKGRKLRRGRCGERL
jgi:hypothetical protein